MPHLVTRTDADIEKVTRKGDHTDSWKAGWEAIRQGSAVIKDIQRVAQKKKWTSMKEAEASANPQARTLLKMRLDAIHRFKIAPHHQHGFRMNARSGAKYPREVNALCLISGHEGQDIPGLVDCERVVVDAEHMEQALGPASLTEIFKIRKRIGEHVYISTNVSETPQLVRAVQNGEVDIRASAALTASKVVAAITAGADIVKVGFANLDAYKRDLRSEGVLEQMKQVRASVDAVVKEKLLVFPLAKTEGRYPLVSVFFPEAGIDSIGERPMQIGRKGLALTAKAGWQAMLIDTFEKYTGRRYDDFYSVDDTRQLANECHKAGLELWIAGSIRQDEIRQYVKAGVDLICFGGAARHKEGVRVATAGGKRDESIKRPLVENLVAEFNRVDPKPRKTGRR